ncbi:hypothetical protein [Tabrizicola sp.]|uniref:hypothetical protein n=1 Tax=Tabrizicola sp. TaxID=2005166 RepID=UPI003F418172
MQVDMTTQEIWHFIGSFQQITEAARGRTNYDAYKAQKAQQTEGELEFLNTPFKAPFKVGEFHPGVRIDVSSDHTVTPLTKAPPYYPVQTPVVQVPLPLSVPFLDPSIPIAPGLGPYGFYFVPPPPASVAVVFGQLNVLSDQDIQIQHDFGINFASFSTFDAPMAALLDKADALDPLGDYDHPSDVAAIKAVGWQIADDITAITASDDATVIEDGDVWGVHVNGVVADAMPVLADHLPEVPEPVNVPPGSSWEDQVTAEANADPAHIAITGGNSLVNEVVLTASWLDAPVMLVQGDYMSVSVICQINVVSEHLDANHGPAAQSQMINAALQSVTASPLPEVPPEDLGQFPTSWTVTTLHADLVVCNWMTQQNFVIDHDVLSLTWSGASTFLRLGDNTLINVADLLELGQGYDLIVIGGDVINVSMIRQMNVLLDADWVATEGGSATVSAGGNLLWNGAQITGTGQDSMLAMDQYHADLANAVMTGTTGAVPMALTDAAFEGSGTLNVLYITGDYLTVSVIDQTNILGDADQVAALATEATSDSGAEVSVITGSNALVNLATINTVGVDSEIHVGGDMYSDAVIYQANFIDENAVDPYAALGPAALASEAVLFLADGMVTDDEAPPAYAADAALNSGQLDGVNAVLV